MITYVLPDDTNWTPEDGALPPVGSYVTVVRDIGCKEVEHYRVQRIEIEIRTYYGSPKQLTWVYLKPTSKA